MKSAEFWQSQESEVTLLMLQAYFQQNKCSQNAEKYVELPDWIT